MRLETVREKRPGAVRQMPSWDYSTFEVFGLSIIHRIGNENKGRKGDFESSASVRAFDCESEDPPFAVESAHRLFFAILTLLASVQKSFFFKNSAVSEGLSPGTPVAISRPRSLSRQGETDRVTSRRLLLKDLRRSRDRWLVGTLPQRVGSNRRTRNRRACAICEPCVLPRYGYRWSFEFQFPTA